jgi:crotonobetainyl-CoA:carnitine CoA-transferase CaiB-like acyl-CoA transferase
MWMLSSYRVIDCTDERGQLAGFMLAQLGAEVLLVEPPGGSSARQCPPFAGDRVGPDTSLWHWAYNRGKGSVVADLTTPAGRSRLDDLVADSDVLLWTGRPNDMPFTYDDLAVVNPRLVVAVLTPFGLNGPKANWAACDLVVSAAGCAAALIGDADRAPLRWGSPQAFLHGAADMAVGALVALAERRRSGRGQLVDVSAQVSCLQTSFGYALNQAWDSPTRRRCGDGLDFGDIKVQWTYPAADGAVSVTFSFGPALAHFTENLFRWIWEEGGCDEATRDTPWIELNQALATGAVLPAEIDRLCAVIAAFTAERTRAYLAAEASRRRVMLAPVSSTVEVMGHDHLAAREFWDVVRQPGTDTGFRHPGRFVVASGAPLRSLGPAPRLGDRDGAASARSRAHVDPGASDADSCAALSDLRVLDMTWSVAGPHVGRLLADFGATVVHIESRTHPDVVRTAGPFHPDTEQFPLEGSLLYANCNAGKLGIELDLSDPASHDRVWRLVRWADVLIESFSAGAFARMGFEYERIRAVNPRIVMLSSCLQGQTGSLVIQGLGNLTSAMFGFMSTTGWPDRAPSGPFSAYTDVVSPRFALAALLAALEHREATGEGQYLDLSQAECSMHLQATALLDAEVNGRPFALRGNRDSVMAPHGTFPTAGTDAWIAIACATDADWRALASWLERPDLVPLTLSERHERHDELDEAIAARTRTRDALALQDELQGLGIAAHQVQNSPECLADPQLIHRDHFVWVMHPLLGPVLVEGPRFVLSRTPGHVRGAGPVYGQHTEEVLALVGERAPEPEIAHAPRHTTAR